MRIRLHLIKEPAEGTRTVLVLSPDAEDGIPIIRGEGEGKSDLTLLCGACEYVLCADIESTLLTPGFVFKCPRCGRYNETRT